MLVGVFFYIDCMCEMNIWNFTVEIDIIIEIYMFQNTSLCPQPTAPHPFKNFVQIETHIITS